MEFKVFDKLLNDVILPEVTRKLTVKSEEYARVDKLSNFRKAGAKQDRTPQQALLGMQDKHTISIQDFVNDRAAGLTHPLDMWLEKLTDDMAYDALMYALEVDLKKEEIV